MREKKDINIEIGGNIQVAREQAGYTQDTLSEMLGMTPNHLSAIERGASGISLEALQRLCRLLGVSADRIIFGTDEPEAEALALARRISDIKPEYRQQVQELLSAILNMSKKKSLCRHPKRASTEALGSFSGHSNKCRNRHLFSLYCWNCAGNIITLGGHSSSL